MAEPHPDPFTSPDELFDLCDASGRPTGATRRRADVHSDGDWHRSLHCWVAIASERGPAVLLQRRGAQKDTWPLRVDVAVGGHLAAGEGLAEAVREVAEEIGRATRLEDLIPLGRRVAVAESGRIVDREVQDVFLWRTELSLEAFRPRAGEVAALLAAPLDELLRLQAGRTESAAVRVLSPAGEIAEGRVRADDFVPTVDRYFLRGAVAVDLALRGYPYPTI